MNSFFDIYIIDKVVLCGMIDNVCRMKDVCVGQFKGVLDGELLLKNCMVVLIFEKFLICMCVSFDLGVCQMGGQIMVLLGKEMQLGYGEIIVDMVCVLLCYVDLIMICIFEEVMFLEMVEYVIVFVINGLMNCMYFCQIMVDVMIFEEYCGFIVGCKVVWLGDGNNVCVLMIYVVGQFGYDFIFIGFLMLDFEVEVLVFVCV